MKFFEKFTEKLIEHKAKVDAHYKTNRRYIVGMMVALACEPFVYLLIRRSGFPIDIQYTIIASEGVLFITWLTILYMHFTRTDHSAPTVYELNSIIGECAQQFGRADREIESLTEYNHMYTRAISVKDSINNKLRADIDSLQTVISSQEQKINKLSAVEYRVIGVDFAKGQDFTAGYDGNVASDVPHG